MILLAERTEVTVADPKRRSGAEGTAHLIKQATEEFGGFTLPARRKEAA